MTTFGQCPLPAAAGEVVQLAHGGGGRKMHDLLDRLLPLLPGTLPPAARQDGAVVTMGGARVAFTSDSYVVRPLFFPGGDIGRLAVNGTINDLAMCGARPLYLSCSLIIEEGLALATLERVMHSVAAAAREAGVEVVTGDTKVVERGKGDGLYVNTAGIGLVASGLTLGPGEIRPGDAILLSGDLGRHAVAVMSAREGLEFEEPIESDTAPLHRLVAALVDGAVPLRCLRDPTRGGLASTLVELAVAAGVGMRIEEARLAVPAGVRAACEVLGLDPLYLANEGRCVAVVGADKAEATLALMRRLPEGEGAVRIGSVTAAHPGTLVQAGRFGTERVVPMLSGEQLPRIC